MMRSLVSVCLCTGFVNAAEWAVLVAGSSGYGNYRHQADVAHAYQIVKKHGIPASNIIVMMYDDVAGNSENPFKGQLFNKPTADGVAGDDVYAGITIDYKGKAVTPEVFSKVLAGDADGLATLGSGKVLRSTSNDEVFVNFVDHGGVGLIGFPNSVMHATQLVDVLKSMHEKQMYKRLVFYLEACESGSMFATLPTDIGIYATTAANAKESSWGTYCNDKGSKVNGKSLNTCLGDLYSVNWMENVDASSSMVETLLQQYAIVRNETAPAAHPTPARPGGSHVLQFGELTVDAEGIGDFMGSKKTMESASSSSYSRHASVVDSRDASLFSIQSRLAAASTDAERAIAADELAAEVAQRKHSDNAFRELVALAYPNDHEMQASIMASTEVLPLQPDCELAVHKTFAECPTFNARSGHALKFQRTVVKLCADVSLGWQMDVSKGVSAAQTACRLSAPELFESMEVVV